jgi:ribonuclease HII
MPLDSHYTLDKLEAGVDEVARGCLAGPVFAAAVIWPRDLELEIGNENTMVLKDSKKLSRTQRNNLREYIEAYAIDYAVASVNNQEIDSINIRNASFLAMHRAIAGLNVEPDLLLVDGNAFKPYLTPGSRDVIEHKCIVSGDDKYQSIAAASILAKVYHDDFIDNLLRETPELEKYGWQTNMCYGTSQHLEAIKNFGITPYHRKSFGPCK